MRRLKCCAQGKRAYRLSNKQSDDTKGRTTVYICHQEIRLQHIDLISVPVSLSCKKQDPQLPFPALSLPPISEPYTTQHMHPSEEPLTASAKVITVILFLLHTRTQQSKGLLVLHEFPSPSPWELVYQEGLFGVSSVYEFRNWKLVLFPAKCPKT